MRPINAPINREEPRENRATEVANLQDALIFLLTKAPTRFALPDRDVAADLARKIEREKLAAAFDATTEEGIQLFQREKKVLSGVQIQAGNRLR